MPSAGRFTSQFAMVGLPLSFNQVVTVGDDKHHDHSVIILTRTGQIIALTAFIFCSKVFVN